METNNGENKPKSLKVRVYSPLQLIEKKRVIYQFEGKFLESFGKPERHAKWFITGPSGSGKSSFVFDLCANMLNYTTIDYNSHEEGDSQTVVDKLLRHNIPATGGFKLLDRVPCNLWLERLLKRKSSGAGVLDSLQHGQMSIRQYCEFVAKLCNPKKGKMLFFISHHVTNDFVKFVRHDCDIKVDVRGFIAFPNPSRYGGGKPYVIWEEGAKRYWKKKYNPIINGSFMPIKQ